ncbi:MAG: porin [Betaproteobacteria bacterium]|nr:porin [Betaproteobacteria bacterium]
MQKKLMAVAVAGVFAAPALALAQSSTVQIYGRITYEYGYVTKMGNDPLSRSREKTDVAQTPGGSAIGFRGQEKLGGGLTAWFQCESSADVRGINQDGLCTRNSAIGFKGKFGNLHFGRWDSPFKRAINMGTVGVKDTGLLGHSFIFAGGSGGTNAIAASNRNRWKRRDVGWTYYESPTFSGFQLLAGFTPGNDATNAIQGSSNYEARVYSVGATFKNGPFALGAGWERHSQFGPEGLTSPLVPTLEDNNDTAWNISAAYTFMNKVKIGGAYLDAEYETSGVTNGTGISGKTKKKNWLLGLDWKIAGPHSLHLGYVNAGDSKGTGLSSIGDVAAPQKVLPGGFVTNTDSGGTWYSIAYEYSFSKRTSARFGYVAVDPDTDSRYTLGGLSAQASGQKQNAVVMYLQHNF